MLPSSFHLNQKISTLKILLKYHKEILYAIDTKNKEKLKLFSKDSGLFDTLPLRRG